MRVKWLRNAAADLDAEAAYIAQEDPGLAMKMYAYIRDRVETLGEFPESGRPRGPSWACLWDSGARVGALSLHCAVSSKRWRCGSP